MHNVPEHYCCGDRVLLIADLRTGADHHSTDETNARARPAVLIMARELGAALDIVLVRKLGVPGHEELAMGAIASAGVRVINEDAAALPLSLAFGDGGWGGLRAVGQSYTRRAVFGPLFSSPLQLRLHLGRIRVNRDVFVSRSTDHGRSWSPRVRVNNDPKHNGIDQFFQWLAVDPIAGAVYVQFYDRRADPNNRQTGFTLARSTDGGKTFTNYAWSDTTFGAAGFLGDYTWLTAYNNRVYGIWTEAAPPDGNAPAPTGRSGGAGTIVRVGTTDFWRK